MLSERWISSWGHSDAAQVNGSLASGLLTRKRSAFAKSDSARKALSGKRCYRLHFGLFCQLGLFVHSGLRLNLLENRSVSNGIGERPRNAVFFVL
jgi:hypothetical protein